MATVHLFNAAGLMAAGEATEFLSLAQATADDIADDLGLGPVDVAICDYPGLVLDEVGMGGRAECAQGIPGY